MGHETDTRRSRSHATSPLNSSKSVKPVTPPPPKKSQDVKGRYTQESFTNPFLNFMRDYRKEVKNDNMHPRQIISLGSQRWRGMIQAERAAYIDEADEARKHKRRKRSQYTNKCGIKKSYKVKKSICQNCGYYIRQDDSSREPSTCTTVSTRTSRSPSDSCEEFSDDSRRSWH